MLKVTEDQKRMFYTSGYSNNYVLTFPDIALVIDNDKTHSETPVIKESICDGEDFALGGCIASSMEFEVSEILADKVVGLEFHVQIEVKDDENRTVQTVPMGIFRVDQAQQIDDKDYKKITAYDRMFDISVDVTDWYNDYFANGAQHNIKKTRESLLTYLGIPFLDQTLVNDDVLVEKTVEFTSLAGTDVLRSLCVINGGFGRMNRQGVFEVLILHGLGLFPEDSMGEEMNLYPSEILYPEDSFEYLSISDVDTICPEYRSCKYEEYMTMPITCLNIQSTENDVGVTVGDDLSNPYVITANFFLYGKSSTELQKIGQNILGKIREIVYRPNTTQLDGLPYMEAGDVFALEKKNDSVESYIFSRTLSGIQALIDTYESKGNKLRVNEVSANEEIIQLKGKSLVLKKTIDEVSAELSDLETDTSTRFEQTSNSIVLKVDSKGNLAEVALGVDANDPSATKFTVTAKNIELSAEETMNLLAGGTLNLSGKNIKIESDHFLVDESGNATVSSIDITGGSINIGDKFVVDENGICSELEGDFTINAKNIEMTAEETISLMAGGTLNLSGKDINIESDNFSVDQSGEVTAKAINIEGGSINITTSANGKTTILLRNAKYEWAYDGPIRFFRSKEPASPKSLWAKLGDFYYDTNAKELYKCTGIAGTDTLFWTTMFQDQVEIPENINRIIRFYGSGEPKQLPIDMDARIDDEYLDLETADVYTVYNATSYFENAEWRLRPILKLHKEDISWKELQIGTDNSIEIQEYKWKRILGEYYKISNGISVQSDKVELKKSGYNVIFNGENQPVIKEFETSGGITLEEGEPDEYGNVHPVIAFDVPIKVPSE